MKRVLLACLLFTLARSAAAIALQSIVNGYTGKPDYITRIDTSTAISVSSITFPDGTVQVTSPTVYVHPDPFTIGVITASSITVNGGLTVTNSLTPGVSASGSQFNTGDPNTVGLIVKGNAYTPAGVQPNTVSGLILWLKEDSLLALNDGDPVGTWTDSSNSAANATAAGSARPTYKTNIIGGKPAILFDGSANFMTGSLSFTGTNKLTAFMVMQNVTQTGGGSFSITRSGVADSNDTNVAIVNYNNNGTDSTFYKFNPGGGITNPSNGTPFIYTIVDAGATSTAYLNGTAGSAVGTDGTNFNVSVYSVGSRFDGPGAFGFAHCYIAETILYNTNLGTTDRTNILAYLSNKYGIAVPGLSTPQTSALQQWQDSAGVTLSSVSASGYSWAPGYGFNTFITSSSSPSVPFIFGVDSGGVVYISTGTGAGAWVKVGGQ